MSDNNIRRGRMPSFGPVLFVSNSPKDEFALALPQKSLTYITRCGTSLLCVANRAFGHSSR